MLPDLSASQPLKVFLIEDSMSVRRQLTLLISKIEGVEIVGEAEDADTALSGIATSGANVAVVDFRLVQGTVVDVLLALAGSSRSVVTIVLTNHATAPVREACLSAGADYFYDKTGEFDLALKTIGAIARDRRVGVTPFKRVNNV